MPAGGEHWPTAALPRCPAPRWGTQELGSNHTVCRRTDLKVGRRGLPRPSAFPQSSSEKSVSSLGKSRGPGRRVGVVSPMLFPPGVGVFLSLLQLKVGDTPPSPYRHSPPPNRMLWWKGCQGSARWVGLRCEHWCHTGWGLEPGSSTHCLRQISQPEKKPELL